MHKILIVDDDPKILQATDAFLKRRRYRSVRAATASETLRYLSDEEFAVLLLDFQMPEMIGDELAEQILKQNPSQQIAMYSCDVKFW